jgi:hypothetical protein
MKTGLILTLQHQANKSIGPIIKGIHWQRGAQIAKT